MSTATIDGIYAVYMTGKTGPGFALLFLKNGLIAGADAAGVALDGSYQETTGDTLSVKIKAKTPANIQLIQGGVSGPEGDFQDINFALPENFYDRDFVRIDTPRGPINARFKKIRSVDG